MSKKDLEFKYREAEERANYFSLNAKDPITHELANHYHREAAKYAILLRYMDRVYHHFGKTGFHGKNNTYKQTK